MLNKKSKNRIAMSLTEVMVASLIAAVILTGVVLTYYYATKASSKGFEKTEAQQSLNKTMDYILRDLRTTGIGVNYEACGIYKEDAIGEASYVSIGLYGNFLEDIDGVELVKYGAVNDTYLLRTVYRQTGTGPSSSWSDVLEEKVLIGNKIKGQSKIRLIDDPNKPGFMLTYINDLQTPFPTPLVAIPTPHQRTIKRVDISITIADPDGKALVWGTNTTGRLRNLDCAD